MDFFLFIFCNLPHRAIPLYIYSYSYIYISYDRDEETIPMRQGCLALKHTKKKKKKNCSRESDKKWDFIQGGFAIGIIWLEKELSNNGPTSLPTTARRKKKKGRTRVIYLLQ